MREREREKAKEIAATIQPAAIRLIPGQVRRPICESAPMRLCVVQQVTACSLVQLVVVKGKKRAEERKRGPKKEEGLRFAPLRQRNFGFNLTASERASGSICLMLRSKPANRKRASGHLSATAFVSLRLLSVARTLLSQLFVWFEL